MRFEQISPYQVVAISKFFTIFMPSPKECRRMVGRLLQSGFLQKLSWRNKRNRKKPGKSILGWRFFPLVFKLGAERAKCAKSNPNIIRIDRKSSKAAPLSTCTMIDPLASVQTHGGRPLHKPAATGSVQGARACLSRHRAASCFFAFDFCRTLWGGEGLHQSPQRR